MDSSRTSIRRHDYDSGVRRCVKQNLRLPPQRAAAAEAARFIRRATVRRCVPLSWTDCRASRQCGQPTVQKAANPGKEQGAKFAIEKCAIYNVLDALPAISRSTRAARRSRPAQCRSEAVPTSARIGRRRRRPMPAARISALRRRTGCRCSATSRIRNSLPAGGLPPSPVAGMVEGPALLPGSRPTTKQAPFIIGGFNAALSGPAVSHVPIAVDPTRKRTYWGTATRITERLRHARRSSRRAARALRSTPGLCYTYRCSCGTCGRVRAALHSAVGR